jgi:hypothetical protein
VNTLPFRLSGLAAECPLFVRCLSGWPPRWQAGEKAGEKRLKGKRRAPGKKGEKTRAGKKGKRRGPGKRGKDAGREKDRGKAVRLGKKGKARVTQGKRPALTRPGEKLAPRTQGKSAKIVLDISQQVI